MFQPNVNFYDVADDSNIPHDKEIHLITLCQKHAKLLAGETFFLENGDIDCACQIEGCTESNSTHS